MTDHMKKALIMNKLFGEQKKKERPVLGDPWPGGVTNIYLKTKDRMLWLINLTG